MSTIVDGKVVASFSDGNWRLLTPKESPEITLLFSNEMGSKKCLAAALVVEKMLLAKAILPNKTYRFSGEKYDLDKKSNKPVLIWRGGNVATGKQIAAYVEAVKVAHAARIAFITEYASKEASSGEKASRLGKKAWSVVEAKPAVKKQPSTRKADAAKLKASLPAEVTA